MSESTVTDLLELANGQAAPAQAQTSAPFTPTLPVLVQYFMKDLETVGINTDELTKDDVIAKLVLAGIHINEVHNNICNEGSVSIAESVITYRDGFIGLTDSFTVLEDRSTDWGDMQIYEANAYYPDGSLLNPADIDSVGALRLTFERKVI